MKISLPLAFTAVGAVFAVLAIVFGLLDNDLGSRIMLSLAVGFMLTGRTLPTNRKED